MYFSKHTSILVGALGASVVIGVAALVVMSSGTVGTNQVDEQSASVHVGGHGLAFSPDQMNCGYLIAGIKEQVQAHITNRGSKATGIVGFSSNCSCNGLLRFSADTIMPGESCVVTVEIIPRMGQNQALFWLKTTDGTSSPLAILYTGMAEVALSSTDIRLGNIPRLTGVSRTVQVLGQAHCQYDLQLDASHEACPWFSVSIEGLASMADTPKAALSTEPIGGANEPLVPVADISIEVAGGAPLGYFRKAIGIIVTDAKGQRVRSADVSGRVLDELYSVPNRLVLLPGTSDCKLLVRSLTFPFRVTRLSPSTLTWDVATNGATDTSITVVIRGLRQAELDGRPIEVHTTHRGGDVLRVPVEFLGSSGDTIHNY